MDCATALFLCDKTPITIETTGGNGEPEDMSATCLQVEFGSTWLRWKIAQAGSLIFLLTPDGALDDLDFAVFKMSGAGDCDTKTLVRCMAAGEEVGDPNGSIPCSGSTGLAVGETDVTEQPGCSNGNNNFLAPLDCLVGEEYVLLVNNFTESSGGFTLTWGGNAEFSCDSTSTAAHETAMVNSLKLYPNPANDILHIELTGSANIANYRIMDSMGRSMESGSFIGNKHDILLDGWCAGMFFLVLEQDGRQFVSRFFVHGKD